MIRRNEYGKADYKKDEYRTEDLLELMRFLRSPEGCPWDRDQTHESIKSNVVEEAFEVVDAIESQDPDRICDELGDLLLQIAFHSQIAQENGHFNYNSVLKNIYEKLISRHTHLFGENRDSAESAEKVLDIWDKNKIREKKHKNHTQALEDIPRSFPSLLRAYKIQKKASKAGFDWSDIREVALKTEEEFKELREAEKKEDIEEELGDLLFSVVNYARFLEVDPELALDKANNKFIRRFEKAENMALDSGTELGRLNPAELDVLWKKVKENET